MVIQFLVLLLSFILACIPCAILIAIYELHARKRNKDWEIWREQIMEKLWGGRE